MFLSHQSDPIVINVIGAVCDGMLSDPRHWRTNAATALRSRKFVQIHSFMETNTLDQFHIRIKNKSVKCAKMFKIRNNNSEWNISRIYEK